MGDLFKDLSRGLACQAGAAWMLKELACPPTYHSSQKELGSPTFMSDWLGKKYQWHL